MIEISKNVFKNIDEYDVTIKKIYRYDDRTDCVIAFDNKAELCVAAVNANSEKIDKGDAVKMNIFFTLDCVFRETADGLVIGENAQLLQSDDLRILYKRSFDKCEYERSMPIAAVIGKVIRAYKIRRSFNTYFVQGGAFEYRISCIGKEFTVLQPFIACDDRAAPRYYATGDILDGNYEAVARIIKKY